jgi:SAM-dependent methyltransferase
VGCGIGGTSRYLASTLGASVTGITISSKQVQIARRLSKAVASSPPSSSAAARDGEQTTANPAAQESGNGAGAEHTAPKQMEEESFISVGSSGRVRFLELDAEKMGEYFIDNPEGRFDVVWISEALSHFPDKAGFFRNAAHLLCDKGGRVVVADWFKAEALSDAEFERDIKPIEGSSAFLLSDGTLGGRFADEDRWHAPPTAVHAARLCRHGEGGWVGAAGWAEGYQSGCQQDVVCVSCCPCSWRAGTDSFRDISWSLVQNPSLWAFAFSQGRDGIAFLQAFRAMRRGYANGSFRYAVMSFVKP